MKVMKSENYTEVTVLLKSGEDYEAKQVINDAISGCNLKMLGHVLLVQIAQKNGYDSCSWSGYESNGKIEAKFRKRIGV